MYDPELDADERVAAYWSQVRNEAPTDGDGNPLPDRIRQELALERERIDAYFASAGLITL